jgi:hypothetical protein
MSLFLIVFLLCYGGMHLLFFVRVRRLLPDSISLQLLLGFFLVLMVVAPIGVRLLERGGHELAARWSAHLGYWWMGFLFLSFCGFLFLWIFQLVLRFSGFLQGFLGACGSLPEVSWGVLALAGVLCVYGHFEAWDVRTERLMLETSKLPVGIERIRIVQITDVHLGLVVRGARLERVLEQVRAAQPDLLVSTGDLVDGQLNHLDGLSERLSAIRPRYGKYAVTGNHEFYAGLPEALEFTHRAGFTILRGESRLAAGIVHVAGIDYQSRGSKLDEVALLSSLQDGRFVLFLKHLPVVSEEARTLFDLQLSGHTHRGQVFPFRLVTGMIYPLQDGFYPLPGGRALYTSRGSGTWGPPMRVFSPPEVTVIDLVRSRPVS